MFNFDNATGILRTSPPLPPESYDLKRKPNGILYGLCSIFISFNQTVSCFEFSAVPANGKLYRIIFFNSYLTDSFSSMHAEMKFRHRHLSPR